MADTVTPGKGTSEYALSRAVIVLSTVISVLGTITTVLSSVTTVVPPTAGTIGIWLAIGGAVVAGLKSVAYEMQRTVIKVEAIKAGQAVPVDAPSAAAAAAELGKV